MAFSVKNHDRPSSVFRLNGADENSATFALGWVLEQSPRYRAAVVAAVFDEALEVHDSVVALQKPGQDGGYTDLEIQAGRRFHLILEAKRWWDLPTVRQLARYRPRLLAAGAKRQRLVSVSAAERSQARRRLPAALGGVPIVHLSWGDLQRMAKEARSRTSGFEEKLWLAQLIEHLGEFVMKERQTDNNVFVVSLGRNPMNKGKTHTWIDVVEKDGCYFHPIDNGWPVQPPNYVGFRYRGRLQSVHHIKSFEIVENLAAYNRHWPERTDGDHFVYRLGSPMRPPREVRTGKIYPNGRVWCAIDTLLSGEFTTVSDARDETQRRLAEPL